jgi:hypothetical protein
MESTRYSFQILMKLGFFWTDFRKTLKYKILLKSVHWEPSCSVKMDRHDEADSRYLRDFANAPESDLRKL